MRCSFDGISMNAGSDTIYLTAEAGYSLKLYHEVKNLEN